MLDTITHSTSVSKGYEPVTLQEAMAALWELYTAGCGRSLPTFDHTREHLARVRAIDLQERYLLAGGAQ